MRGTLLFWDNFELLTFFFSTLLLLIPRQQAAASKCVVSKWREWSECQGNCEFGQRVRNRDVLRPPFPEREKQSPHGFFLRECPPLYEVEQCTPRQCADESPFSKLPALHLNRLPTKPSISTSTGSSTSSSSSEELALARQKTRQKAKRKNIEDESLESPRRAEPAKPPKGIQKHVLEPPSKEEEPRRKVAGIGIHREADPFGKNRAECAHQNQSCCRVVRASCASGGSPRQLIRWYRKKDEQFCRPYKYAFCEELSERVFATEADCLDTCFSDVEKAVLPNFRVI